jgi:uncharacterized protein (TIGR03435 family)
MSNRLLLIALLAWAYAAPQAFEVASVKLVVGAPPHAAAFNLNHEKVTLNAATLRQLTGYAYNIQRVRVLGGPEWTDTDEFDVVAKAASPNLTRDDARAMLRTLLAERFQLKTVRSIQQVDQYSLVVGKNGSKLKPAVPDGPGAMTPSALPEGGWTVSFKNRDLVGLVNMIANFTNSPVHDETGLKEKYDFEVTFRTVWEDASAAASGPTLFEAVERLGLKLVKSKGPQDVITILSAERPEGN